MLHRDPLSEMANPWMLLILGGLCMLAYQFLGAAFYLSFPGSVGLGMGMLLGALAGVMLPLNLLTRRLGISFRRQFLLRRPGWKASLLTLAATLSMIPALEVVTQPVVRAFPPEEGYLDFLQYMRPDHPLGLAAILLGVAVAVPLAEELLFRGLALRILLRHSGPWVAALLTGLLFGAVHPLYSAPAVALLGIWFAVLTLWGENLSYPLMAHAAWNLANLSVLLALPEGGLEEAAMASPFSGQPLLWLMISLLLAAFFSRLLHSELTGSGS